MSATEEPTADETETETETHAKDQNSEQSKSESSMLNNQTGPGLLEDEEMPSYISISSQSRREDTELANDKEQHKVSMEEDHSRSPYPSDDQGGGSVYVLSSEEDSNHEPYTDEEDDDYKDSEGMEEIHPQNYHHRDMMGEEEEEEEEEDDDEEETRLRMQQDEDDEFDTDYEPEFADRALDDIILNNTFKKQYKERSLSLQDLSICKDDTRTSYSRKRYSLNLSRPNRMGFEQNFVMNPIVHNSHPGFRRYQHVESKVKQYIKDIKEQNRRSMERRRKDQEYTAHRNHVDNKNSDVEQAKSAVPARRIKDYVEKTMKELQHDEPGENRTVGIFTTDRITENGDEEKFEALEIENDHNDQKDFVENQRNPQSFDQKTDRQNGSVDQYQVQYQQLLENNTKSGNDVCVMNGHQQTSVYNVRTLSYEEYMQGVSSSGPKEASSKPPSFQEERIRKNVYSSTEIIPSSKSDNSNASTMKVDNVKTIQTTMDDSKENNENFTFLNTNQTNKIVTETVEVMNLKMQLTQKTEQIGMLRDVYQKTLAENIQMKQEIEMLRNALAKQGTENKPRETKVASVQTEVSTDSTMKQESVTTAKEIPNKISTSSVASTLSSIEQWTESVCSPAISLKLPDVTAALNSDDSMIFTDNTPRKSARPLSRAFITSSRILQTLSNITQGKVNLDSRLAQSAKKEKEPTENSTELEINDEYKSQNHASTSKKRKATDMMGPSPFLQPFKIPHTSTESPRRRISSNSDVDIKGSEETGDVTSKEQENGTIGDKNNSNLDCSENNLRNTDDQADNVKCFVYRDDESGEDNSFLIQTEEPTKDRPSNEKGRVRECGPYLLGNVEVRMIEVNGTINIWGKTISQSSMIEKEDELDTTAKSTENKSCPFWQKTPQIRLNGSTLVSSTNKKYKGSSRLTDHNTSQCTAHMNHSSSSKSPLLDNDLMEDNHPSASSGPNTSALTCENCNSANHSRIYSCNLVTHSQDKIHSCCSHHTELTEQECGCANHRHRVKHNEPLSYNRDKCTKCSRKSSFKTVFNSNRHSVENLENFTSEEQETGCKSRSCRCPLQNTVDSCQQQSKCCNSTRDIPYTNHLFSGNTSSHDITDRHSCHFNTSNECEEDPLICTRRSHEPPEIRQRRLRGKKVRGILMDLFRGCGDCRKTSINNTGKGGVQHKEPTCLSNNIPYSKISPNHITEASCSGNAQPAGKCCRAYEHRIETQLEEFRMDIERVRSRSDAILNMLSTLHSVDMN